MSARRRNDSPAKHVARPKHKDRPTWVALGQLVRISLAPSALADALLGAWIGCAGAPSTAAIAVPMGASLAVYLGGLALNDVVDREEDQKARPERPLPSGAISPAFARFVAYGLLLGGPALAATVSPRAALVYLLLAAVAATYDLAGRGPWRGPSLLALARGGNVAAAAVVAADAGSRLSPAEALAAALPVCLAYGAYVFAVSRLGRMEDDLTREPGQRPRAPLKLAALLLALGPLAALAQGDAIGGAGLAAAIGALALALTGAAALWRASERPDDWSRADVVRAMGLCLRRLLVFTAAAGLASGAALGAPLGGLAVAFAILLGYPISTSLRRRFPPS